MRNYTRKTRRGLVSQEVMLAAAREVLEKGRKLRPVAKDLDICHATLFRFIKKLKAGENPITGYKPRRLFTKTQEHEIAKYLARYNKVFFGLSIDEAKKLAYQCAVRMNYPISSIWIKNGTASREWLDKFLLRHPIVHIRATKATSETSRHNVNEYFSMLYKLFEEFKFPPSRIYHLVDIGVTPALKYRKMADGSISVSVGERKPVNVQLAVNATGEIIPPMFVLPVDCCELQEDRGFYSVGNSSGQLTASDFSRYINHFTFHAKPNPMDPILLLLDNHQYYIDINVLEEARASSIILLSFPPYCKEECVIQPMEMILESFQANCKAAQVAWMQANPGKCVAVLDIPDIVRTVLPSESEIQEVFRITGVWPFDPAAVTGEEFVPLPLQDEEHYCGGNEEEPGPSCDTASTVPERQLHTSEQDPLTNVKDSQQCRVCGKFSEHYFDVMDEDRGYIAKDKTVITINDLTVELDFDNDTLPNTVCRDCDVKLQGMLDFVNLVKTAQESLKNVADTALEIETLVVKTEYDSPTPDDEESDIKEGIVDSLNVSETECIKTVSNKRKGDKTEAKQKKAKVTKESEVPEVIVQIKEEFIEVDIEADKDAEINDGTVEVNFDYSEVNKEMPVGLSDTGPGVKPCEVELATNALISEMASEDWPR